MSPIVEARLAELERWHLKSGGHTRNKQGNLCAMEAAAYVAGEKWGDHPVCVCPTIGAFLRSWNDGLPTDADRDRLLKPFIPRIIGTAGSPQLAERRAYLALDWLVRVYTPTWLELKPELRSHAQALRALEALRDTRSVLASSVPLKAAREASAATWAAAMDATWAAASAAARAAASAAAWAAAWAAAMDAARAATWAAASAATWAAAMDALAPTALVLQQSACDLLDRMIALTEEGV